MWMVAENPNPYGVILLPAALGFWTVGLRNLPSLAFDSVTPSEDFLAVDVSGEAVSYIH